MLDFKYCRDEKNKREWIETSITGKFMLYTPQLNKGTAFSEAERRTFKLLGKLPYRVETLEEQVKRAYQQYKKFEVKLNQHLYLMSLLDQNQVLFYRLVAEHLEELVPIIYTPIVGTAIKSFSREFRQPRGLYISYPQMNEIETILANRSNPNIDLIVASDGESVLGIGDQGVGGIDIPIAKLLVYTLCGGINPLHTLPILLDVGTNNEELLNDPLYLGWRNPRISQEQYDEFIEKFVSAVRKQFPQSFLHWEDMGCSNARRFLVRFQKDICSFNDDLQGTGVVALSALRAAVKSLGQTLKDQRIIVFGAGTAGTGISDQIVAAMKHEGLTEQEAHSRFWLVDRFGLITENTENVTPAQIPYKRSASEISKWNIENPQRISLAEVVTNIKPTVLIGCSSVGNAFTEDIIKTMAQHVDRPIIFPLSNPTEHAEATPENILQWTECRAFVATGSPFDPVTINEKTYRIPQCNNALAFPGIGLGVIACKAKELTDSMIWAACEALMNASPAILDPNAPLLPSLNDSRLVAKKIAASVILQAQREGLDRVHEKDVDKLLEKNIWEPHYIDYVYR